NRYAIGPVVDIRVWRKVGIETGAMYKRVGQQTQFSFVIVPCSDEECTNGVVGHYGVSAAGRSWEFPVAGQYHFSWRWMRPYAEGGFPTITCRISSRRPSPSAFFQIQRVHHPRANR